LSTGADGSFEATLLPPAKYYVVVNKSGFAEAKAINIEVRFMPSSLCLYARKIPSARCEASFRTALGHESPGRGFPSATPKNL
jgi:hypothetical protein